MSVEMRLFGYLGSLNGSIKVTIVQLIIIGMPRRNNVAINNDVNRFDGKTKAVRFFVQIFILSDRYSIFSLFL